MSFFLILLNIFAFVCYFALLLHISDLKWINLYELVCVQLLLHIYSDVVFCRYIRQMTGNMLTLVMRVAKANFYGWWEQTRYMPPKSTGSSIKWHFIASIWKIMLKLIISGFKICLWQLILFMTIWQFLVCVLCMTNKCLQCFDAVGWVAGRASGL